MKILVTGGAGYIGSHMLLEICRDGHEVHVVDNYSNSSRGVLDRIYKTGCRNFSSREVDVRDGPALKSEFMRFAPDIVVHFAGIKSVGESCKDPVGYYDVNVHGSINVLAAMKESGCKNICFSSSATVYGKPEFLPISEDHPVRPVNPYGKSKLMVEEILLDQSKADPDFTIAILRYFNPAGADKNGIVGEKPNGVPDNLLPYVADVAAGERCFVDVFGADWDTPDGTGVRDYIHVSDLARAHVAAVGWCMRSKGARIFNLGSGKGTSVFEIIDAFKKASGREIKVRVTDRRDGDIGTCVADSSRANAELGWTAECDINDMVASAWKWRLRKQKCDFKS